VRDSRGGLKRIEQHDSSLPGAAGQQFATCVNQVGGPPHHSTRPAAWTRCPPKPADRAPPNPRTRRRAPGSKAVIRCGNSRSPNCAVESAKQYPAWRWRTIHVLRGSAVAIGSIMGSPCIRTLHAFALHSKKPHRASPMKSAQATVLHPHRPHRWPRHFQLHSVETPVLPLFAASLKATPAEIGWIVMAQRFQGSWSAIRRRIVGLSRQAARVADLAGRVATAPFLYLVIETAWQLMRCVSITVRPPPFLEPWRARRLPSATPPTARRDSPLFLGHHRRPFHRTVSRRHLDLAGELRRGLHRLCNQRVLALAVGLLLHPQGVCRQTLAPGRSWRSATVRPHRRKNWKFHASG